MFQNESNHVRRRTALAQGRNKCDFDEEKKSIVSLATFTRKPPMYDLGDTRNQFLRRSLYGIQSHFQTQLGNTVALDPAADLLMLGPEAVT